MRCIQNLKNIIQRKIEDHSNPTLYSLTKSHSGLVIMVTHIQTRYIDFHNEDSFIVLCAREVLS